MGGNGGQLQARHELRGRLPAALHAEGHHAAGAVRQVLLRPLVVGVVFQAGVAHPAHLGVSLQEPGHGQGVFTVPGHAQGQGLQPHVEQVGVHGGGDGAEVPHELGGGLGDVGSLQSEALGVGHAVVALIRGGEAGELVGVGCPVEPAGVHDSAAHRVGVAVHVLGSGMGDNVGPPLEGAADHRGGEGVVHDEGHAVGVGRPGELLKVQHGEGGVGDGLAKDGPGLRPEGGLQLGLGAVGVDEGEVDAHALHRDGEEVIGTAVDGG